MPDDLGQSVLAFQNMLVGEVRVVINVEDEQANAAVSDAGASVDEGSLPLDFLSPGDQMLLDHPSSESGLVCIALGVKGITGDERVVAGLGDCRLDELLARLIHAELAVEREAEIAVPLDAVPLTSDQTHDELTEMVYSVPLMA